MLRPCPLWLSFSFLLTAACSSSGPQVLPEFVDACEPAACGPTTSISTAAELVALADAEPAWPTFAEYTSGCLRATDDVAITGTITVQATDLAGPTPCDAACRDVMGFVVRGADVDCLDPVSYFDFTLCRGITVRDTTLRLRRVTLDIHPAFPNYVPAVELVPACAAPCGAGELACAATHLCYGNVRDHCAFCLGGDNEACACWDGDGFAADGTACELAVSGDVIVGGTCHAGLCVM